MDETQESFISMSVICFVLGFLTDTSVVIGIGIFFLLLGLFTKK